MHSDAAQRHQGFWLGEWRVKPSLSQLERDGVVTQLEPKVMVVLETLASEPGEVFSRQMIEEKVWHGSVVGYDALAKAINKLRDALGDDKKSPRYIQTISKKGYRLIARVDHGNPREISVGAVENAGRSSVQETHKSLSLLSVFGAVLISVTIVLSIIFWPANTVDVSSRPHPNSVFHNKPTIVILPFRNIGPSEADDYLAEGLTSDLTTNLSKQSSLWVTASNAVLVYKNSDITSEKVRREFKARYVLSGEVNKIAEAIRINVRLTDLQKGKILWAEHYGRHFTDLFAILDEVTKNILDSLSITLTNEEKQRIAGRFTHNLQAYDYFLRGQSLINIRTPEDNNTARDMYRKAIELDPVFPRAYAGLAMTYTIEHVNQWPGDVEHSLEKALELSRYAINLDRDLPESYFVAGFVNGYRGKTDESMRYINKALSLDSNYADAYTMMAWLYLSIHKPEKALGYMTTAMHLNPNGGYLYHLQIGKANYQLGHYEMALSSLLKAKDKNPTFTNTLYYLAATYASLGRYDEAGWMILEAKQSNPGLDMAAWLNHHSIRDMEIKKKLRHDLDKAIKYSE